MPIDDPSAPAALTILLADDDRSTLKLLESVVRRMGHRPIPVSDGLAALRAIEAEPIDMLISDIEMPHLSGIDLCRTLREKPRDSYLFTVLISAQDYRDVAALLDAGADDFITKPVIPAHLQARIRSGHRIIASERKVRAVNRVLADRMAEIQSALTHAEQIQRLMLPRRQVGPGYRAHHHWVPSQNLSGDILAVVDFGDGTALFYNLDVAGHGIRAALQATELFHIIEANAQRQWRQEGRFDLVAFLEALNRSIVDRPGFAYVAGSFVTIRTRDRQLEIVHAGTDALHLVDPAGTVTPHLRPGFPIGLFDRLDAVSDTVDYRPGTTLIVASDGVDLSAGQMAALPARLAASVAAGTGDDPIAACLSQIAGTAPPADDLSLSVIALD